MFIAKPAYTFDDVTLIPVHSEIRSRKDPSLKTKIDDSFLMSNPIISSPMNTVTELEMIKSTYSMGCVGVLHRYMLIEDQVNIIKQFLLDVGNNNALNSVYVSIGANGDFENRVKELNQSVGINNFCIDVANGHSIHCLEAVEKVKSLVPSSNIMAGNVCSYDGALRLAKSGVSSIRVGVGAGAVCITRQVTGHGVPQLTAVHDCSLIKNDFPNVAIISDGGIRKSGDIVKSLAAGADAVMLGSLLAGTHETPGEIIEQDGQLFKYYRGMASEEARATWFDRAKAGLPGEGVSTKVPFLGKTAKNVIDGLCQSVKVGLSYSGAQNINELQKNALWCTITSAGYIEGTPHGRK